MTQTIFHKRITQYVSKFTEKNVENVKEQGITNIKMKIWMFKIYKQ